MRRTGLILFSGPMGSGKTSTMYDLVRQLRGQRLVMTIEDPVEIYEPQFLQLQVNAPAQ
ncbi:GspE family protein, partial [Clostridioides difficile]|nr:GspE family protein [Clostridioides difficile]